MSRLCVFPHRLNVKLNLIMFTLIGLTFISCYRPVDKPNISCQQNRRWSESIIWVPITSTCFMYRSACVIDGRFFRVDFHQFVIETSVRAKSRLLVFTLFTLIFAVSVCVSIWAGFNAIKSNIEHIQIKCLCLSFGFVIQLMSHLVSATANLVIAVFLVVDDWIYCASVRWHFYII